MINKLIDTICHIIENGLNDLLNITLVLENLNKLQSVVWMWLISITISLGFWVSLELAGFLLLVQNFTPLKSATILCCVNGVIWLVFFLWLYKKFNTKTKTATSIILLCKVLQKLKEQTNNTS